MPFFSLIDCRLPPCTKPRYSSRLVVPQGSPATLGSACVLPSRHEHRPTAQITRLPPGLAPDYLPSVSLIEEVSPQLTTVEQRSIWWYSGPAIPASLSPALPQVRSVLRLNHGRGEGVIILAVLPPSRRLIFAFRYSCFQLHTTHACSSRRQTPPDFHQPCDPSDSKCVLFPRGWLTDSRRLSPRSLHMQGETAVRKKKKKYLVLPVHTERRGCFEGAWGGMGQISLPTSLRPEGGGKQGGAGTATGEDESWVVVT
ncbi:hypothetical protein VUR80DRAFT_3689 [Thermomyces stellatus]